MDITELSDIQSESGVIGTLIYHPEFILHTDYLLPSYFYGVENGCIYWAIQDLYKNGVITKEIALEYSLEKTEMDHGRQFQPHHAPTSGKVRYHHLSGFQPVRLYPWCH